MVVYCRLRKASAPSLMAAAISCMPFEPVSALITWRAKSTATTTKATLTLITNQTHDSGVIHPPFKISLLGNLAGCGRNCSQRRDFIAVYPVRVNRSAELTSAICLRRISQGLAADRFHSACLVDLFVLRCLARHSEVVRKDSGVGAGHASRLGSGRDCPGGFSGFFLLIPAPHQRPSGDSALRPASRAHAALRRRCYAGI